MIKYVITLLLSAISIQCTTITAQERIPVIMLPEVTCIEPTPEEEVYLTAIEYGLDTIMAKLIVAQARHESGKFSSKLYRKGNNAFGMMRCKRDTLALSSMHAENRPGYAMYATLENSTIAVLNLLSRKGCKFNFKSPGAYANWLKSVGYYEDSVQNYSNSLRVHYNKLEI